MAHHHKSNAQVEGSPDSGHGDGMPLRPDDEELVERTQADREREGLPRDRGEMEAGQGADAEPEASAAREAEDGAEGTGFPPSRYDG